jgi:hypothetical protein
MRKIKYVYLQINNTNILVRGRTIANIKYESEKHFKFLTYQYIIIIIMIIIIIIRPH